MVGQEIASLYARVGAEVGDFSKGMEKVKADMSFATKGITDLQGAITGGLKFAAAATGVAIGGLTAEIGHAVTKAADMQQGIADIGAMMSLTSTETVQLQDHIMALGLNPALKVSAEEAAQAVMALGTAGLDMTQIMGGASEATVLLANATGLKGGEGFSNAASIATDVMAQFNITAADMGSAVDQIAGTTIASKLSIDDYRLAIAQAGGVAGSVGVDFEDFNAVIAATSPSFASGSDAGTSFKTFLQRLVPTTSDAKEELIKLGLSAGEDVVTAFFDASGAMRPMEEIAENLQNATMGLSEAQKIQAFSTIFGTDAMRTAFALAEGGGEIIQEMKRQIGNVDAEELAAKRMDTLSGSWEIFRGVIDSVELGIGQKFLPVARKLVDWATELAQNYGPPVIAWFGELAKFVETAVDWVQEAAKTGQILNDKFAALPTPIKAVIESTSKFVEGVKTTVAWVEKTIGQFVGWQDILIAVGGVVASVVIPAIGAFLATVAPATAVFAGLVAASALLRKGWEEDWLGIRSTLTHAWEIVSGVFNSVAIKVGWIVDTFRAQWTVLNDINASVGDRLALVWNTLKDVAGAVWQGIVTTVQILLPPFVAKLKEWGEAAWTWIVDTAWPMAKQKISEWAAMLLQLVQDNTPKWIQGFVDWARGAWQWIVDAAPTALEKVRELGTRLWTWVQDNAPQWGDRLKQWGDLAWQEFAQRFPQTASALTTAFETAKSNVTNALDYVGSRFGPLGTTIQTFGVGALREIGLWVTGSETDFASVNAIVDATKEAFGLLWDDFAKHFPATAQVVDDAWVAVSNSTKIAWTYVTEKSAGLVTAIQTFGADSLKEIVAWATGNETEFTATTAIWQEFSGMATTVGQDVMSALKPFGEWLKKELPLSAQASVEATQLLNETLKDLSEQTGISFNETETITSKFMDSLQSILDTGLAIAIGRVSTFAANLGQVFIVMKAGLTGDWESAWQAIKEIQANNDAQVLREAELMGGTLKGIMETAGKDSVEGFRRGVQSAKAGTSATMQDLARDDVARPFMQELQMGSPSRLFEQFGRWSIDGFVGGINSGSYSVLSAFNTLGTSINSAMTSIVSTVGSQLNSTMQSVVEGVRYGANAVNFATADVLYQSQQAEKQARAAWEKLRSEMQKPLPPPPPTPPTGGPNPWDPDYVPPTNTVPPIILPPIITPPPVVPPPPPPPPPPPFDTMALRDAIVDVTGDTVFSDEVGFFKAFAATFDDLTNVFTNTEAENAAVNLLKYNPAPERIDEVLAAVQTLVQAILTRGLGSQLNFDITSAPGDIADNRTELSVLIEYLTAIYAT